MGPPLFYVYIQLTSPWLCTSEDCSGTTRPRHCPLAPPASWRCISPRQHRSLCTYSAHYTVRPQSRPALPWGGGPIIVSRLGTTLLGVSYRLLTILSPPGSSQLSTLEILVQPHLCPSACGCLWLPPGRPVLALTGNRGFQLPPRYLWGLLLCPMGPAPLCELPHKTHMWGVAAPSSIAESTAYSTSAGTCIFSPLALHNSTWGSEAQISLREHWQPS